ncbi:MAG: ABC transporter ATP-binding protein [Planctomycetaceae bacterium]
MNDALISVRNLCRGFGRTEAVNNVSLEVNRGSIHGLLGTNGAGKTTLIRVLMGHLYPDSGDVLVLGQPPRQHNSETLRRVAYVSDRMELPSRSCLANIIRLNEQFFPNWNSQLASRLTKEFNIDPSAVFSRLSLGQKRRAVLLQAICQGAELLILDEPFSGLDAIFRRQCLDMLLEATVEHGQTILVSSHLLHDIERIVDTVTMMCDGRVFAEGNLEDFKRRMRRIRVEGAVSSEREQTLSQFKVVRRQMKHQVTDLIVDDYQEATQHSLAQTLGDKVIVEHMNLEDIFVELSLKTAEQSRRTAL